MMTASGRRNGRRSSSSHERSVLSQRPFQDDSSIDVVLPGLLFLQRQLVCALQLYNAAAEGQADGDAGADVADEHSGEPTHSNVGRLTDFVIYIISVVLFSFLFQVSTNVPSPVPRRYCVTNVPSPLPRHYSGFAGFASSSLWSCCLLLL
jgi:hypothetical protein